MVQNNKLQKLDRLVKNSDHIVLLQADNPDLDSLGSARALQISLTAMDIDSTIVSVRELRGANKELFGQWVENEFPSQYDTVILCDTGAEHLIKQAKKAEGASLTKKNFVVIDHHPEEAGDFRFADIKIIETASPAAAEIVYSIARSLDWPMNKEFAESIMQAYMYDSRKFTIDKVQPQTLRNAADLLEYGLSMDDINYAYDQAYAIDPDTYKRKAKLIRGVSFYRNDSIAVYTIGQRLRKWLKSRGSLSEYLKYELLSVRGVKISAGLTKQAGKRVLVTMRAHEPVAQAVAEQFGGGGHPKAAGCMMEGVSLRQAKKLLVEAVSKQLDENDQAN